MMLRPREEFWQGSKFPPRQWQAEALEGIALELAKQKPAPFVIQAVMGAGKSVAIAEITRIVRLEPGEVIVITTSSQALVEQLSKDISARRDNVGRYYSRAKEVTRDVIVACIDSAEKLAGALSVMSRRVALWIADEAHRTETDTVHRAHELFQPDASIGFTATPYRSQKSEELSLFRKLLYEYGPREALRDKVILPWRVIPWTGGSVELDEACVQMCREGVEQYGPGVINAVSIDDAEAFTELLEQHDIKASVVHSRIKAAERNRRIEALRKGELQVICHVSMLQEGVNLPWLKWLCLRRKVGSRVRFAQEVGRVLRTFPGKTEGIVYDPHDLFAEQSLTVEAVLYGQAQESSAAPSLTLTRRLGDGWWSCEPNPLIAGVGPGVQVKVHRERRPNPRVLAQVESIRADGIRLDTLLEWHSPLVCKATREGLDDAEASAQDVLLTPMNTLEGREAIVLDKVSAYLRQTTIELDQRGLIERKVASHTWRKNPASPKQWGFILKLVKNAKNRAALVPEPHRSALRHAIRVAHSMNRGQMSDLIEILLFLVNKREWPLSPAGEIAA